MLFARLEFHKTRMRRIAVASKIEQFVLDQYIFSKDDILLLFCEAPHVRLFALFDELDQHPDRDPAEQPVETIHANFATSRGYYRKDRNGPHFFDRIKRISNGCDMNVPSRSTSVRRRKQV